MRLGASLPAIFALLLLSSPAFLSVATAQPSQGNWVVTGQEVVENRTIALNGNLTVIDGGSLTLRNVTLTVNSQYNGQYGISVEKGGSMFIYDSNITASDLKNRFAFVVQGDNFEMTNSGLHGVGWCSLNAGSAIDPCMSPPLQTHAGPLIETDNALIENNTISENGIGLLVTGSHMTIVGNRFSSNDISPLDGLGSSFDSITNNTLSQNPTPFDDSVISFQNGQNDTFYGNTVTENISLAEVRNEAGSGVGRMDGINTHLSSGIVIANNSISVANVAVCPIDTQNSTILDNRLTFGETGVLLPSGDANTKVEGNKLLANGGTFGIYASLAHDSIVANNSISALTNFVDIGIYFDHTSNGSILNNNVSSGWAPGQFALVVLLDSKDNSIAGNTLWDAQFGIVLSGASDGNVITDNDILADHSVTIQGASSNLIYLNNLYDLKGSAGGPYDNGKNAWNGGNEGNYWCQYTLNQSGMPEGDEPYVRTTIPPNGTELYSQPTAVRIVPAAVPRMKLVAPPSGGPALALHLIKDQTIEIDDGGFAGNLTIVNSTLLLGKEGEVVLGTGSLTIENSKLVDMGYGYVPLCNGPNHCAASLFVKNSTLDGAMLADLNYDNITIEGSLITNSQGDHAVSVAYAKSVVIVNNTFSGAVNGINTNSNNISISGNKFYNIIENAIYVGVSAILSITIADNLIVGNLGNAIQVSGNAVVRGNMISDVKRGPLQLSGDNNTAFGNAVSDSSNGGWIDGNGNVVYQNNFNDSNGLGITGNGNVVYQNNFINDSSGLGITGNGNVVYQNNFINDSFPVGVNGNGNLIYHNNFINFLNQPYDETGRNSWSYKGEGNYWSSYTGKDANFDGIGDTPYTAGGITDSYPFMKPNGWLTKFYLTLDTNLPASTAFQINGTSFSVGQTGTATLRLGYVAAYSLALPQTVKLANGTTLSFSRWGDGVTSVTRTLKLSANSTLEAVYVLEAFTTTSSSTSTTTTTTSTSSSTLASSSSMLSTRSSSSTTTTSNAVTPSQTATTLELAFVGVVAVVLVVLGAILLRRRGP